MRRDRAASRTRTVLAAAVAAAAAGLCAASAQASVVSMTRSEIPAGSQVTPKGPETLPPYTSYGLSILAGPGETNTVEVERATDAFVVRDGAGASAGENCTAVDPWTVRCPTPPGPGAAYVLRSVGGVELGDGNDSFQGPPDGPSGFPLGTVDAGAGDDVVAGASKAHGGPGDDRLTATSADGGPGDDDITASEADGGEGRDVLRPRARDVGVRLRGGEGDDVLNGSPAADTLDGGGGADRLDGASGDDQLRPGPGADAIDGGDGSDTASFAYATAPVRADLAAAAPADPTGEGDALSGVESLEGGAGDDELRGDDGVNRLIGGGGRDVLDGRGGHDDLSGGEAEDSLDGGAGDDVLVGGTGADRLQGGPGRDDLAADDAVADDEERGFESSAADGAPDTVLGDGGDDLLDVSSRDRAAAGGGDDLLVAHGRPGALACGRGARDTIDTGVLVPRDCERVRVLAFDDTISTRLRLRRGGVYVRVPSFLGPEEPTRVTLRLRVGGRIVGRGRRVVPDGASRVVRIPVSGAGRRLLRASRSVRLDVIAADSVSIERDVVVLQSPR